MDSPNIISLHIKFLNRQIYIHNIYNLVNAKKISKSISILEQKLVASPYKDHITLGNLNLHHKSWKEPEISTVYIEKLEELLLVMQR